MEPEPERVGLRFPFPAQEQDEGSEEKAPVSWTLIFVPGTVLRALTKMGGVRRGDRVLSILEMRELRPRKGTCPRPHIQKWCSWDQTLLWWLPDIPACSEHSGATLIPRPPAEALTHVLPSGCIMKNPVLEHEVSL